MKILVISQYYTPEPFRIHDVCAEMVRRGHEVTVVTDIPNYPMGRIYDGYRHRQRRDETLDGVKVHRCYTIGRRTGPVWRALNYYSYALSAAAGRQGSPAGIHRRGEGGQAPALRRETDPAQES